MNRLRNFRCIYDNERSDVFAALSPKIAANKAFDGIIRKNLHLVDKLFYFQIEESNESNESNEVIEGNMCHYYGIRKKLDKPFEMNIGIDGKQITYLYNNIVERVDSTISNRHKY